MPNWQVLKVGITMVLAGVWIALFFASVLPSPLSISAAATGILLIIGGIMVMTYACILGEHNG